MLLYEDVKQGSRGEIVLKIKKRLLELGYYDSNVKDVVKLTYGGDTFKAVNRFKRANGMTENGIVTPEVYDLLFPNEEPEIEVIPTTDIPANISVEAANKIAAALVGETEKRIRLVRRALAFASNPYDPKDYPISLYIRGGNLYNADLTPNVITLARIASGAKRQPEYYDGGRAEMMNRAVMENPEITGADCSGGIVGLYRVEGIVKPKFDMSADGFAASNQTQRITKDMLRPADLLHKSGHIGMYVGGGYAVEWLGGSYGCQLTKLDNRIAWDYVEHRLSNRGKWTTYLRPKYYKEGD